MVQLHGTYFYSLKLKWKKEGCLEAEQDLWSQNNQWISHSPFPLSFFFSAFPCISYLFFYFCRHFLLIPLFAQGFSTAICTWWPLFQWPFNFPAWFPHSQLIHSPHPYTSAYNIKKLIRLALILCSLLTLSIMISMMGLGAMAFAAKAWGTWSWGLGRIFRSHWRAGKKWLASSGHLHTLGMALSLETESHHFCCLSCPPPCTGHLRQHFLFLHSMIDTLFLIH